MDDTDRIRRVRRSTRLLGGRLDRGAPALLTRLLLGLTALAAVLLPGAPAWAHNALAEASPAKEATLKKAPTEVKLRFLQKLDPDYTIISVSDADKQKVATDGPEVDGATGVVTFSEPLTNGVYTVAYQVVSTDGHTVKGSYRFTLNDPSATEAPAAAEPSAAPATSAAAVPTSSIAEATAGPDLTAASDSEESGDTGMIVGVAVAAVVILAGVAGLLFARKRNS
ncbi:copper resistance CopC family protein [Actinoplanes rectilineatus]|uniref:copper resistance CopC family protein n=1 Tax=Actinoplanes rectilineatus TaxID=113571 RepID=UPI0009FA9978|nr:copper resistance CopC family protein [Actinoplanes rectilineatus]